MNTIEFYLNYPLIPVDGGIYLVKDCEHRFVASNSFFSKFSGIKPEKLQGLCDFDMPWDEHSQMYIDHEKAILSGENYKVLEPLPGVENAFLHTSKSVLFDQKGRPAGTAAMALLVNGVLDFKNIWSYAHFWCMGIRGRWRILLIDFFPDFNNREMIRHDQVYPTGLA